MDAHWKQLGPQKRVWKVEAIFTLYLPRFLVGLSWEFECVEAVPRCFAIDLELCDILNQALPHIFGGEEQNLLIVASLFSKPTCREQHLVGKVDRILWQFLF